jgi:hypothetical protein
MRQRAISFGLAILEQGFVGVTLWRKDSVYQK